jgi:hypothetical protein
LLAKLEPGTRFELGKMPVDANIWLPKHFSMVAKTKALSLTGHHERHDETYFNYRKAKASVSSHRPYKITEHLNPAD